MIEDMTECMPVLLSPPELFVPSENVGKLAGIRLESNAKPVFGAAVTGIQESMRQPRCQRYLAESSDFISQLQLLRKGTVGISFPRTTPPLTRSTGFCRSDSIPLQFTIYLKGRSLLSARPRLTFHRTDHRS